MIDPLGEIGSLLEIPQEGDGMPKSPGSAAIYPKGGAVVAPSRPFAELFAHRGRTMEFIGALYAADKTTGITLDGGDVVRVKIGRSGGHDISLDLDQVATAAGSVVVVGNRAAPAAITLRLAQGDTASLAPGTYLGEISVVDSSESGPANAIKHAQEFILHLLRSQSGDIGI